MTTNPTKNQTAAKDGGGDVRLAGISKTYGSFTAVQDRKSVV